MLTMLIISMALTVQQVDEVVITRAVVWESRQPRATGRSTRNFSMVRKGAVNLTVPSAGRRDPTSVMDLVSRADPGESAQPNYIHMCLHRVADGLSLRLLNMVTSRPGHDHKVMYGELLWSVGSGP